jgi:hypothetical protein
MAKICTQCGYAPDESQELQPGAPIEDCPQCGGLETVREEKEAAEHEPGE